MTAQARLLGGRYQVGELLGYGGMAEVHRGRDLRLGRDVAVKMLRVDLARDATFQERFRREAQNAAALNHPAIVAVYDTGEEVSSTGEKLPFIVMEFVSGRTLKEVLAAEQRLMPRRALEITADICAALEFSHRHGIIHRDIKPGNVMLTPNGQVKVMDFGIARALASGATTMTQTSAVIGTAQYLSPEQARGESVDARSDVYAAGCVLFELMCGHPPFVGDSPVSVAYQHVREEPRAPSDINPEVPPDVDAIVLKALAKNPLNRYQSAQEMRADALRAVSGRPVLATPVMNEAETMAIAAQQSRGNTGMTRAIPASAGGPEPRRASSWVMAVLAGLSVLAVIALGVGVYITYFRNNNKPAAPKVDVPQVVGMSEEQAKAQLTALGLKAQAGDPSKDKDCRKDTVVKQDPKDGQSVEKGQTVTYTMCVGPDAVKVPDLAGSTWSNAELILRNAGLEPQRAQVDSDQPLDQVIKVEKAGSTVDAGSTIKVEISKNNKVKVPTVEGQSQAAAEALLKNAGLTSVVQQQFSAQPPGTVIQQNPQPEKLVNKNSQVSIIVAKANTSPSPSASTSTSPSADSGNGGGLVDIPQPSD